MPMSIERFGAGVPQGSAGGTGIAIYNGAIYAEQNDKIMRYALPAGCASCRRGPPQIVVSGSAAHRRSSHASVHHRRARAILRRSRLRDQFLPVENRMPGSPGHNPCTELETRAGIWRYDANKTGQHFSPAERFATGLRNGEGFAFDAAGRLFATQHGRDQLSQNLAKLYTAEQGAELPAEELVELDTGRRLRLAGMLLRRLPEEAGSGAGIWRRWRQEGRRLRREDGAGRVLSRRIGRRTIC